MSVVDLSDAKRIGVISDTHGLVRRELYDLLDGVDAILHAGDLGSETIEIELAPVAPFYAVAGNVDGFGASPYPRWQRFRVGGRMIGMTHVALSRGGLTASVDEWVRANPLEILVFGHTHQPLIESKGGLTLFNPGSCGPRRFSLPITIGFIDVRDDGLHCSFVDVVTA